MKWSKISRQEKSREFKKILNVETKNFGNKIILNFKHKTYDLNNIRSKNILIYFIPFMTEIFEMAAEKGRLESN